VIDGDAEVQSPSAAVQSHDSTSRAGGDGDGLELDASAATPSVDSGLEVSCKSTPPKSKSRRGALDDRSRSTRVTTVPREGVPTIVQFVEDRAYCGLQISPAQRTLLKAIYGVPLDGGEEEDIFAACTGRTRYTAGQRVQEVTIIAGARSGKDSRIAAPIALYEAIYGEYPIARGEPVVVPLVAQDGEGSAIAFAYIASYSHRPRINVQVDNELTRELWVRNVQAEAGLSATERREDPAAARVVIKCFACSAKSIRGWTIPAGIMDEVAFFRVEGGANADEKVQTAIRRGGVALPRQTLVKISTPHLKGGVLWDDVEEFYGAAAAGHAEEAGVLVWRAKTTLMNPAISEARLARERVGARRRKVARVEFDAEFAEDVTTFLPQELLEPAVVGGRHELAPVPGRRYVAAVDPSGGGVDAFALAIVHVEHRGARPIMVQDVMKSWRAPRGEKIDLDQVVDEIAAILARFGLYRALGDHYAGEWPKQAFRKRSVLYERSELDKSAAYIETEPWVTTGSIELLDHPELLHELGLLEKRLKPGGKKPTIDHPKGGHDDHANALALAVAKLAGALHAPVGGTLESFAAAAAAAEAPADPAELTLLERMYAAPARRPIRMYGGADRQRMGMFR
jgi:hypothetical protein